MILTEQEAYKKACPFARDFNADETTVYGKRASMPLCIGTACMAWDWLDPERLTAFARILKSQHVPEQPSLHAEDAAWVEWEAEMYSAGWHLTEGQNKRSAHSYWIPHPARRGQCQRCITVAQE